MSKQQLDKPTQVFLPLRGCHVLFKFYDPNKGRECSCWLVCGCITHGERNIKHLTMQN